VGVTFCLGVAERQGGWRHRPGNYKAPLKSDRASFCTFRKRSLWNLSLSIYCCLSKPNISLSYG